MARILKNVEQEKALKCVNVYLKELEKVKDFVNIPMKKYKIRIEANADDGTKVKIAYEIEDSVALDALNHYRKGLIKKIEKLKSDNKIGLEEEELALLNL